MTLMPTTKLPNTKEMTESEWNAEGESLFGTDRLQWRFICPACSHVANVSDWKSAGLSSGQAGFSCVGRALENPRSAFEEGDGPCNYAGGGLIGLNPVRITSEGGTVTSYFAFAPLGRTA